MNKLKKTIIVFCFISILLILDDLIAKIYADSNDSIYKETLLKTVTTTYSQEIGDS